jgi:hypothetical protein
MSKSLPRKVGRPTKYHEGLCEMLIEHMSEGLSFESFAAKADCHFDQLYSWCKKYPEFYEAKNIGIAKSLLIWERLGIKGAIGELENFNVGSWIFNMKNRFKWRDKLEVSGDETKPIKLAYDPRGI